MDIILSRQSEKFLDKLNDKQTVIVMNAIKGLTAKPPKGDIRKLRGYVDEKRLRIGTMRILFKIKDDVLYVSNIDFRGNVY
ncbi:MAG: type II toxin-antitoxin system RelE/ParE family toxin [Oscillospiraceae bacterium]|nr:type II toxin-antitoxin system RelE/ParE family toxin [Oscillospiraceae bacterium]